MTYKFDCYATTHIGNRRANNEDNFFIGEFITRDEQSLISQTGVREINKSVCLDGTINRIFAVSDGMGGHKNGEVASSMAVEAIREFTRKHLTAACRKDQQKFLFVQNFQQMIHQTNLEMLHYYEGDHELDNMGTTLSGLIMFADEAVAFNVGDSSTYLFMNDVLNKLTVDDNEAERFSDIDNASLEANGKRLTKYLGMPESNGLLSARISEPIALREGQIYIIASDGLTDSLSTEEIKDIIKKSQVEKIEISKQLVESALGAENGGSDNVTVVVLKVQKHHKKRSNHYGRK